MNQRVFVAAALASAIALVGCHREQAHGNDGATVDTNAVVEQLRRDEAQWVADWTARDADRVLAHYADGATLMVSGAGRLTGDRIRAAVSEMVGDPNFQIQFAPDQIGVGASGDLAYTRGTYSLRTTNPQTRQPQTEAGNYLSIYRRQSDGSWKSVEDIVSAGAPAATPGPAG